VYRKWERRAKPFATDLSPTELFQKCNNSIDTAFTLPQYLVLRTLPVLQVGGVLHSGPAVENPLQGKIVHGGTMATKKKAKKKKH
jgi:hypothetical protein